VKSRSLNLLESSGPVQTCSGIALPLPVLLRISGLRATMVTPQGSAVKLSKKRRTICFLFFVVVVIVIIIVVVVVVLLLLLLIIIIIYRICT
jgi:hypothetical protein